MLNIFLFLYLILIFIQYIHIFIYFFRVNTWDPLTVIPLKWEIILYLFFFMILLFVHSQQVEATARLDFLWKIQVTTYDLLCIQILSNCVF